MAPPDDSRVRRVGPHEIAMQLFYVQLAVYCCPAHAEHPKAHTVMDFPVFLS